MRGDVSPTVCFRIEAPREQAERLIAELYSLGTLGIEERDGSPYVLLAYFSAEEPPTRAVTALGEAAFGIRVTGPERVRETDWERAWRAGLEPRCVGPLWIRPSWCASRSPNEIQLDPEQAFGSGEHASTRLALELVLEALVAGDSVLDVGTGSGILGLGALRMGAGRALGVDLDRQACVNAAANSARNGLALNLVCGTLAAIVPQARFEIVVCNLLLGLLEPWLVRIAGHASRTLVVSGYLSEECEHLRKLMRRGGLVATREVEEQQSGDIWCASVWRHARVLQSANRSSRVSSKE